MKALFDGIASLLKSMNIIGVGLLAVWAVSSGAAERPRDGSLWLDDKGVHINAHGGGVIFENGLYWWYGEHKVYGEAGNRAHVGVHVYSSSNLVSWADCGIALAVSDDEKSDIADGCILERPKVLRSKKTGRFVMYFHLELKGQGYRAARTGIAVADRPQGPFAFVRSFRPTQGCWPTDVREDEKTKEAMAKSLELGEDEPGGPSDRVRSCIPYLGHIKGGQMSRDMALFADDDRRCYHIFASEYNSTLHIAELTEDLLGYTGRWWRLAEKDWTEAPSICKHRGWYYILGSGCTGWAPNAARYYRSRSIAGPWERMDNPCRGTDEATGLGAGLTWGGQSTCIFPVRGKPESFIAMFDRWCPTNAIDGRYVWREITFSNDGRMTIPWHNDN